MSAPLLEVADLRVRFRTDAGAVTAVDGVDLRLERGGSLALVGESGSGKSALALALLGLHDRRRTAVTGGISLDGLDILTMPDRELRRLRGDRIAMVFQDPGTSLHPYFTVGEQVAEAYRAHNDVSRRQARSRALDMLGRVGIADPARRYDDHPHVLSGGLRQRVLLAMALVCEPDLLVADEPTTALDVTVQAQLLDLFVDLRRELGTALLLITHDLGIVGQVAEDVVVMYAGRAVEAGRSDEVLRNPQMPYTWALLGSVPRLDRPRSQRLAPIPGSPPPAYHRSAGCAFEPRCPYPGLVSGHRCVVADPELLDVAAGHRTRCHLTAEQREQILASDVRAVL
ncbi:MAG: ABC transporter ATP-binding protein [Actinomycetota bacterium]|nr:MAG: ABC transporter ATP-binding protein [Actinomycetota bacterium]